MTTFFQSKKNLLSFTNDAADMQDMGEDFILFRSQETYAKIIELGLDPSSVMTQSEMEQKHRAEKFFEDIEILSASMKSSITQYIGYIASCASQMALDDFHFNVRRANKDLYKEYKTLLDDNKDLKSQIKVQDNNVKALEEAQLAFRSASKQIEELKSKLADMEKEKTKIQNQLAKTTIANEKLQDKLNNKGKK